MKNRVGMLKAPLCPRKNNPSAQTVAPRAQTVFAVSHLVRSAWDREGDESGLIPERLDVSGAQRETLQRGVSSYVLPGQRGHIATPSPAPAFETRVSPEVLKVPSAPQPHLRVVRVDFK